MKVREQILQSADQVELATLVRASATPISLGLHDERVDGELDDEDAATAKKESTGRGRALDDAQGKVTEEIDRRSRLLGADYPFQRRGNALEYTGSTHYIYEFMLAAAVVGEYSSGRYRVIPRVFEVGSTLVAQVYLGHGAKAYRTGWPRPFGEPKRLKGVIEKLRAITGDNIGEWVWHPKQGKPLDPTPQIAKEQGLDLVAWKPSPDGRTGLMYMLGQCACGSNWGSDAKLHDLNVDKLEEWFDVALVPPMKSLFTPHHADDDQILETSRRMKGLIFDRARMVLLAKLPGIATDMALNVPRLQRLTAMCASKVPV